MPVELEVLGGSAEVLWALVPHGMDVVCNTD